MRLCALPFISQSLDNEEADSPEQVRFIAAEITLALEALHSLDIVCQFLRSYLI